MINEEHVSSALECRTRNRENAGSNPSFATVFSPFFSFSSLSCIDVYLAIDSCGNVNELSSPVITAWLACFS